MDQLLTKARASKAYDWLTKRRVYHTLFWTFLLILLIIIESKTSNHSFGFVLGNELITVGFYAILVYFNLWYLIPNYLNKEKFLTYIGLLILSVMIVMPLKAIIFYFKFYNLPGEQVYVIEGLNWSLLPLMFVTGCSTIVKIISDWMRQLREKQELVTQNMQSELRFLKSQINPHFLFNTLNNLYALTLKKSDKAPDIVLKLSEMMRYMLYECNEKRVPLKKEVNYIKNYLDLEALRQGKSVRIDFEVNGTVSDQKVAPLMFIPFLENCFKHGVNHSLTSGFVNIRLDVLPSKVHFFIENSKPETMPTPDRRKSGGIGLVNVKRRLNLLYPEQYELEIHNNPKTYAVEMSLEL